MTFARKVAIAVLAGTMGLGIIGVSAPAQADTTWGYVIAPITGR
ncbi:hypothetical protein [Nocardioides sp. SYSU DS0663]